jgi:hypothetical protein
MLMDAEFGDFVLTGVHPSSSWTEAGPMTDRFAAHVLSVQRRVAGEHTGGLSSGSVGLSPWAATGQLAMTSRSGQRPVRYLWYPAWRGSGHALGLVVRSLRAEQPALVYNGRRCRSRSVVLVVDASDESLSYYDPVTGRAETVTRSQFGMHTAPDGRPRELCSS